MTGQLYEESGGDLALGLAIVAVVASALLNTVLFNWAVRAGHLKPPGKTGELEQEQGPNTRNPL